MERDERKRMIAKTKSANIICDSGCVECNGDQRMFYGLPAYQGCPIGLSVSKRTEEYVMKNPSAYQALILNSSKSLQKNSFGKINPEKIKSNLAFLKAYLVLSEPEKPQVTPATNLQIMTYTSAENTALMPIKMSKALRLSSKARNLLMGLF